MILMRFYHSNQLANLNLILFFLYFLNDFVLILTNNLYIENVTSLLAIEFLILFLLQHYWIYFSINS